jgi:hypothetical protein
MLPTKFNQKQESSVVAMFANGSRRNEQSLQRTFHRCFLPSFCSFDVVSIGNDIMCLMSR